jgi:hypothetical protein
MRSFGTKEGGIFLGGVISRKENLSKSMFKFGGKSAELTSLA